ncbi:MAG: hypothetical protein HGA75_08095 [Thiobacillus sp.]|nr:hypothetical protein [Thiobacillus sp.]
MNIEDIVNEKLEWLLNQGGQYNRTGKHLIALTGALADDTMPEHVARQMEIVTRQVMLWDILDSLINSLDILHRYCLKPDKRKEDQDRVDIQVIEEASLMAQIEATRKDLVSCEPVNHAELIAWVVGRARDKKLISTGRNRR